MASRTSRKLPQKFLDFVETFHRQPGEYTEKEKEIIGIYHQRLDITEKNWEDVVKLLGITDKTSEQFRKWILQKRYKENGVLKNPKLLDDKTIDEVVQEDVSGTLMEQRQHLIQERMKLSDERTAYNRVMREGARLDRFIDTIKEVADKYAPLPAVVDAKVDKTKDTCEAVYGLADLHLGPIVENCYNTYNYDEAVNRVNKIARDVIHYCKLHNVSTLHFINMGDLIAGLIHPTIRLDQEYDVIEQTLLAAELVAELLNTLRQAAPNITYRSVLDNHARVMPDKNQHIEAENLNRIIDVFVEQRLKGTNVKFIDNYLDKGIGRFYLNINGQPFYFMHGHEDKKTTVVQDIMGLTHEFPSYIFMAHYHQSSEHTFQGAKLFISGSVIGTDAYAFGKRLFNQPEQKLLIFDSRDNVIDVDIRCKYIYDDSREVELEEVEE